MKLFKTKSIDVLEVVNIHFSIFFSFCLPFYGAIKICNISPARKSICLLSKKTDKFNILRFNCVENTFRIFCSSRARDFMSVWNI